MNDLIMDTLLKDCKELLDKADGLHLIEGEGYDSEPSEELETFLEECRALAERLNKFI